MRTGSAAVVAPQLLVSVRNAAEAIAALAGGCDVLDIKEPLRGPLGMADVDQIAAVIEVARQRSARIPVSAALGDARDWESVGDLPQLPQGLSYLKLGTVGLGIRLNWVADWQRIAVRWGFAQSTERAEHLAERPQWILVAYADWQPVGAPSPREVIRAAAYLGCSGVLIDTWQKQAPGLLHWMDVPEVMECRQQAHSAGLTFGIAGRLQEQQLPQLCSVGADVVGIRGAACRGNVRDAVLDASAIRHFKEQLAVAMEAEAMPGGALAS